jgi:hypothetical protein
METNMDDIMMPKIAPLETAAQEDANTVEASRLRDIARRRRTSACDAIALLLTERDIAVLKTRAEAERRIAGINRDVETHIAEIEERFERKLVPARDLLSLVEKLI